MSAIGRFLESAKQAPVKRGDDDARLNRIRAAVIEECAEKSFRLASIASIAKHARVSTASLYRDFGNRDALLESVVTFTVPLIAADLVLGCDESDPKNRLVALLAAQARIFENPHANWLYRAHVGGEVCDGRGLIPAGIQSRHQIEAMWTKELERLQQARVIGDIDVANTLNFLLGASQRRSLLALLLFGPDCGGAPTIGGAIESVVDWLLAASQSPPCAAKLTVASRQLPAKSAMQTSVEADLARHHERTDAEGRHQKILAAAVQECATVGFSSVSMAHVATRAGVSTATLYEHFTDKEDMFVKAVGYMVPLLTASVTQSASLIDPRERIAEMLINHGSAYLDPFMEWLYRLYVSFEGQGESIAGHLGRASRTMTEQFWSDQITKLETEGYLQPSDHATTTNLLLGGVERRTLLTVLLVGHSYAPFEGLLDAAQFATNMLFSQLGTAKFFEEFGAIERVRQVA